MKILFLICLLLTSLNVIADNTTTKPYMLKIDYIAPTERENCIEKYKNECLAYQKLTRDEIAGYTLWVVDCDNPEPADPLVDMLPAKQHSYWFASDKPTACIIMTAWAYVAKGSKETHESKYSEVFIARDFRAPKAATCTP